MAFSYRKGDIVLIANSTSKMGVSFEKMQVKALMVLRECGDEYIICVPLREKSSTCSIKVEASNCLYAMYSSFCRVKICDVLPCLDMYLIDPASQVARVYEYHNRKKNQVRCRREKAKKQREVKMIEKIEQRKKHKEFIEKMREEYAVASMNNDIKRMNEIINKVGYPPIKGGSHRSYYKIIT